MTGIVNSLENLISSIFQTIPSILGAILSAFQGVLAVGESLVRNAAHLVQNFASLILSNLVILGVILIAFVGYSAYQQKQGRQVQGKTIGTKKVQ